MTYPISTVQVLDILLNAVSLLHNLYKKLPGLPRVVTSQRPFCIVFHRDFFCKSAIAISYSKLGRDKRSKHLSTIVLIQVVIF